MSRSHFLEKVRQVIRLRRYNRQTEHSYLGWIRRFIHFHRFNEPGDISEQHIEPFLNHLAVSGRVDHRQQTEALCALILMCRHVLGIECGRIEGYFWANKTHRPTNILPVSEIRQLLATLSPPYRLLMNLIYHTGWRLSDCLQLRINHLDMIRGRLSPPRAEADSFLTLSPALTSALKLQIQRVSELHQADSAQAVSTPQLPRQLARRHPEASGELAWQYLFPANAPSPLLGTGQRCRLALHPWDISNQLNQAVRRARISRTVTWQSFMHSGTVHRNQEITGNASPDCQAPVEPSEAHQLAAPSTARRTMPSETPAGHSRIAEPPARYRGVTSAVGQPVPAQQLEMMLPTPSRLPPDRHY